MELSLHGKVAIITGGSRGIGRSIAQAFAKAGARVMITSRTAETLETAATEIGHDCAWIAGHAGREDDIARVLDATMDRFGGIDILVNNAATNPYAGPVIDVDIARWEKTFDTNLTGPLRWCQHAWQRTMKDGGGSIINLSSVGAFNTNAYLGVYDITKSAVIHLTEQLAAELSPGVRVNAIAPGLVKTDFAKFLWEDGKGEQVAKAYPLKRLGEPHDIAGAAMFLASDASSWITGQTITVDGGGEIGFDRLG